MTRSKDQLVATSGPAIEFPTHEAANAIYGALYQQFTQAVDTTRANEEYAQRRGEEIARRKQQITQLNIEIEQADAERKGALHQAQLGRDVAKAASDSLAVLGSPIPSEQLDILRDGNWGRVEQLHDDLDRGALS